MQGKSASWSYGDRRPWLKPWKRQCSYMKLNFQFGSEKCCVLNTCAHYIRYVKRSNRRWIDSVDPHKNWSTDLNFCSCLVCLLQWRTLFQHTYGKKMCYILLIFAAKFQNFFGGTAPRPPIGDSPSPNPSPLSAPILLPPLNISISPPVLGGVDETLRIETKKCFLFFLPR